MVGAMFHAALTIALFITVESSVPISGFLPFGPNNGDKVVKRDDDQSSPPQTISIQFSYFAKQRNKLWVNTNGAISFAHVISNYTPSCTPVKQVYSMISPYWGDVNTCYYKPGRVYYRESKDTSVLQKCTREINRALPTMSHIKITWAYIATWHRVTFFQAKLNRTAAEGPVPENTFQLVLASDGRYSFAIFYYNKITWTTGGVSGGNKVTGLGGNAARAGFDAGDGKNIYVIPGSCTAKIVNITHESNVGSAGKFVFRVDTKKIILPPTVAPTPPTEAPKKVTIVAPKTIEELYQSLRKYTVVIITKGKSQISQTLVAYFRSHGISFTYGFTSTTPGLQNVVNTYMKHNGYQGATTGAGTYAFVCGQFVRSMAEVKTKATKGCSHPFDPAQYRHYREVRTEAELSKLVRDNKLVVVGDSMDSKTADTIWKLTAMHVKFVYVLYHGHESLKNAALKQMRKDGYNPSSGIKLPFAFACGHWVGSEAEIIRHAYDDCKAAEKRGTLLTPKSAYEFQRMLRERKIIVVAKSKVGKTTTVLTRLGHTGVTYGYILYGNKVWLRNAVIMQMRKDGYKITKITQQPIGFICGHWIGFGDEIIRKMYKKCPP